jgi:hypothetical protein
MPKDFSDFCFTPEPKAIKKPVVLPFPVLGFTSNNRIAVVEVKKLWPNGSKLRIRFLEGSEIDHNIVKRHAKNWSKYANLFFEYSDELDAEIRISFDPNQGNWSKIGTESLLVPSDQATMNLARLKRSIILHEFGHAIGLIHEHQNPQGGIIWNKEQIYADLAGPPNFWDRATVEKNIFNTYDKNLTNGTEVDLKSIMLYPIPQKWTMDGFMSSRNSNLSAIDKAFVSKPDVYGKTI